MYSIHCITMPWGQIVVGPPGSGKTTYCAGVQQFLENAPLPLRRRTVVVNLDPANHAPPYEPAVDLRDLIAIQDVMDENLNNTLIALNNGLNDNETVSKEDIKAYEDNNNQMSEQSFNSDKPRIIKEFVERKIFYKKILDAVCIVDPLDRVDDAEKYPAMESDSCLKVEELK